MYEQREITGYKWQTQQAAQNAQNAARAYFLDGRPPGDWVTTEWFRAKQDPVEGFWYFEGDISPVLGNPTNFIINE